MRVFAWVCVAAGILFAIASFVITASAPSVNPWPTLVAGLKVPQWRMAFETADVILGIDVTTGHEILVFGRDALPRNGAIQILRVSIDCGSDELELLTAACEIYRGHHDFKSEA
jgi:hypothetical protein